MKKISTSLFTIGKNLGVRRKRKASVAPSNETLNLLMQFARSYHVESSLQPAGLAEMVLN